MPHATARRLEPLDARRPRLVVLALALAVTAMGIAQEGPLPACGDGGRPFHLAVGDLDGDGRADLLVACGPVDGPASSGPGHLEVRLGTSEGFGAAARAHAFEHGATSVSLGDLTGDGVFDVVVTRAGPHERAAVVLANDGAGGLTELARATTDFEVSRPALVDVDDDGDVDLAMPGRNQLLRNDGDAASPGPFTRTSLVGMDARYHVHLADVDGDGHGDVAHVLPSAGQVALHASGSDTPASIVVGKAVREVRTVHAGADLNEDGTADLVVATAVDAYTSELRLALSDADAWRLSDPLPSLEDPASVLIGDVAGDEALDLVAVPAADPDGGGYALRVSEGRGDGSFAEARAHPVDAFPYRPVLRDVTGDSRPDLLYVDMEGSRVHVHAAPLE